MKDEVEINAPIVASLNKAVRAVCDSLALKPARPDCPTCHGRGKERYQPVGSVEVIVRDCPCLTRESPKEKFHREAVQAANKAQAERVRLAILKQRERKALHGVDSQKGCRRSRASDGD